MPTPDPPEEHNATIESIHEILQVMQDGYIFSIVTKGTYELPQAGRISHDDLVQHLEAYGYY